MLLTIIPYSLVFSSLERKEILICDANVVIWLGTKDFAGIGNEKYPERPCSKLKWWTEKKTHLCNRHFRRSSGKSD